MAAVRRQQPKRGLDKKELERQREREREERPSLLQKLLLGSISPYRFGDFGSFVPCEAHDHDAHSQGNCVANPHCFHGIAAGHGILGGANPLLRELGPDPAKSLRGFERPGLPPSHATASSTSAQSSKKRPRANSHAGGRSKGGKKRARPVHQPEPEAEAEAAVKGQEEVEVVGGEGVQGQGAPAKGEEEEVTMALLEAYEGYKQSHPGLVNMGNTCYLNVVLQMIKFDRLFVEGLFGWALPSPEEVAALPGMKEEERAGLRALLPKLAELRRCLAFLLLGRADRYSVRRLVDALAVDHTIQEDGLEFYQALLTRVEEFRRHLPDSPFLRMLANSHRGQKQSCLRCSNGHRWGPKPDVFFDLHLPLRASVLDSLSAFLAAEVMKGRNAVSCERCVAAFNGQQPAVGNGVTVVLQIELLEAPRVLRLQLIRHGKDDVKIQDAVTVDEELDLAAVTGKAGAGRYRLTGIIYHLGISMQAGHYKAEFRDGKGRWWRADDTEVKAVPGPATRADRPRQERQRAMKDAYYLIYERVDEGQAAAEGEGDEGKPPVQKEDEEEEEEEEEIGAPIPAALKEEVLQADRELLLKICSFARSQARVRRETAERREAILEALNDAHWAGVLGARQGGEGEAAPLVYLVPEPFLFSWCSGVRHADLEEDGQGDGKGEGAAMAMAVAVVDGGEEGEEAPEYVRIGVHAAPPRLGPYACPHSQHRQGGAFRLDPAKAHRLKAVPAETYHRILATTRGAPDVELCLPVQGGHGAGGAFPFACPECVEAYRQRLEALAPAARQLGELYGALERMQGGQPKGRGGGDGGGRGKKGAGAANGAGEGGQEGGGYLIPSKWLSQYCSSYLTALDQLQLEGYPAHVVVEALLHPESAALEEQAVGRNGKGKEALDESVNARLLCVHGTRAPRAKGAAVTAVSTETWSLICALFPKAIELRVDQELCPLCEALRPLLKRVEDGQPLPELKKLLEAAKGAKASLTFPLVGRAWLHMWRDLHTAEKPSARALLSPPAGSLLLLSCPHAEQGKGEEEGQAARLNLPLFLHDLMERAVVDTAGLKEVLALTRRMKPELEVDAVTLEEWGYLEAEAEALRRVQAEGASTEPKQAACEAPSPPPMATMTIAKQGKQGGGVAVEVGFSPSPCLECKAAREAARSEYFQVSMPVKKRTAEEVVSEEAAAAAAAAGAAAAGAAAGPRRSARSSRRAKGLMEVQVVVSSDDSVELVHLRVAHSGLFAEEDFVLFYEDKRLNLHKTLKDQGVPLDATLHAVSSAAMGGVGGWEADGGMDWGAGDCKGPSGGWAAAAATGGEVIDITGGDPEADFQLQLQRALEMSATEVAKAPAASASSASSSSLPTAAAAAAAGDLNGAEAAAEEEAEQHAEGSVEAPQSEEGSATLVDVLGIPVAAPAAPPSPAL